MGTIKLKRPLSGNQGTPPTEAQLAENEIAMDASVGEIYVGSSSTDSGTDAAILANKYDDADADARVNLQTGANLDLSSKSTSDLSEGTNEYFTDARAITAIEDASSLTLSGGLTTESGLTNNAGNYGQVIYANRDGGDTAPGALPAMVVQRNLGSEVLGGGFDNRGPAIDFNLISDDDGLTQYQGGIQFQSNNDDNTNPEAYFRAYSWDGFSQDNILQANKDWFYSYGRILAQKSATLQNQNGDDEAPLVVKADWDNNDAIAAEFFNISDDDYSVSMRTGTDQGGGSLTYNNQLRSYKNGDRKYQYFDVLNDNGTFNQTLYEMNKETNTGDIKHNMYGQVRIELSPGTGIPNTSLQIQTDMTNATSDLSTGVKTNLNWKAGTIPNDAESFQEFTFQDDTQGQLKVGYFGARYKSANNGELSTMKLAAETHDGSAESILSVNQKEATATVPFKYQGYTTTARNALSVNNGSVIYNTTTDKLEVYAAGSWVPLH